MPFDKKDNTSTTYQDSTSKEDLNLQEKQKLVDQFLTKNNLSDENQYKFSNYITKNMNLARASKNKPLLEYFEKQLHYYNKFLQAVKEEPIKRYKFEKKPSLNYDLNLFNYRQRDLNELVGLKERAVLKYKLNREDFKRKTGYIDNGPYLTNEGLVFPEEPNETSN